MKQHGRPAKYGVQPVSLICFVMLVALFYTTRTGSTSASTYSSGIYGACTYNSCGVSLTSNGLVNLDITPGSSTHCTMRSDAVSVKTDSSTGYTLSLADSDTDASLKNSNGGITPVVGTSGAPHSLTANSWGFRVDSFAGFGSGPSSSISSEGIPSQQFAAIPPSNTPTTLAQTTSVANPAVTTNVWYGACVDSSLPAGMYSDTVTYTAVVN